MAGETSAAEYSYVKIPGNIKQIYLPFVLDPSNPLHSSPLIASGTTSEGAIFDVSISGAKGTPQLFSFRPEAVPSSSKAEDSFGFLRVLPNSYYMRAFEGPNNDIANKLLYENNGVYSLFPGSITGAGMLDNIPFIQVREYLQDSKLDLIFNILAAFSNGFNAGEKAAADSFSSFTAKVWKFTKSIFSDISTIIQSSLKGAIDGVKELNNLKFVGSFTPSADYDTYILKIPYILYYRMLSSTTTNIYELPYSGKIIYESNGNGYTNKGIASLATPGQTIIGKLINFVGKNIRFNTTPTWDGSLNDILTSFDINFSLYNDSVDAAVKNFIFVNTLFPGAKWLQYHIFQHAPNIYDIKIDGINRFFMCSGDFKCEQKGVLRIPSKKMCDILYNNHCNNMYKGKTNVYDLFYKHMIRIPDVYDIQLKFTSLLPNNFNNFLYSYYLNDNISKWDYLDANMHLNSTYYNIAEKLSKELAARWEKAGLL